MHALSLGLVAIRIVLALVLFAHATQKLLGWFDGAGLVESAATFERLGQRPGKQMVLLASASELTSAALLLVGLITPVAVAMGAGTMLVAGSSLTLRSAKLWNAAGGGEYPYVIAAVLLALGFTGPGDWSLDNALAVPWQHHSGTSAPVALGALAVAVLGALPPILKARLHLTASRATPDSHPSS